MTNELLILAKVRDKLIDEAIERSKSMPKSERDAYVATYTDAAIEFYCHSMIEILDADFYQLEKKSA